tara:strand:- start:12285 stop:12950 length:666 start_codon:yes stop_codon:yes gene_type:complete
VIKRISNKIKEKIFILSERGKISREGTLINAFNKSNTIFIHIPKTAGISLVNAVYGDVSNEGHRKVDFYKKIFKKNFNNFFLFSFVRNPYERLYSAYKFLQSGGMNIHDQNAFKKYLISYNNFEDFIYNGLTKQIVNEIIHFRLQSEFICNDYGEIIVDFVGKYETIEKDISQLSNLINKDISLPYLNRGKEKKSYDKIYTDEMKEIVYRIYRKDFEIFNY